MKEVTRRDALRLIAGAAAGAATGAACSPERPRSTASQPAADRAKAPEPERTATDPVLELTPLSTPWQTRDPFLFCVHHDDHYPAGNAEFGPAASLAGRRIGQDFEGKDGWRMYHGEVVPGFPRHPHRGFETVTVVRRGLLDHSDSLGAAARYGQGDVQWLTAGNGIMHAEMFPLLRADQDNPLELFQIWLNLPSRSKRVAPYFSMLWSDTIPRRRVRDAAGRHSELAIVAGRYADAQAPAPPPNSWASDASSDVAIWTIAMEPGARLALPPGSAGSNRSLYVFAGAGVRAGARELPVGHEARLRADAAIELQNRDAPSEMLLLQGRPIGEPIARHGPFVMNTAEEIRQAYMDYRATEFGGWPWERHDPVHGPEPERFARHPDGRLERPA